MPNDMTWRAGFGVIKHKRETALKVNELVTALDEAGICSQQQTWKLLIAADRLCNMAMWLTVQMSYVKTLSLEGTELQFKDFKEKPEGHIGGSLNMVPAYVGYMLANALTGKTRAWIMGQGHCVAAIDSVNVLLGNLDHEQAHRYPLSNQGLSQLCLDFYSYEIDRYGRPLAPLGSHVNPFTAGGISEGGYLGFTELQYMHMPLPGQELVTFLSDGAFEEQRGSDWAPRWWRGEDTGLVLPIMIANGRRIDQKTTMARSGGVSWFKKHLKLNHFEPVLIDGKDPSAFAWAIINMAKRLEEQHKSIKSGQSKYPVKLPYTIAETIKGYGFVGAGTNAAHNLPMSENPAEHDGARTIFNKSLKKLFVPHEQITDAIQTLKNHPVTKRVREADHCLRLLEVAPPVIPNQLEMTPNIDYSPMEQLDQWFTEFIISNPQHRFKVGNPDEMRSNRMNKTLDVLLHRVTAPEVGVAESIAGGVITALNEEAVVSAALANKQGINLVVSYEAFAVKMLGAMRQEINFARHMKATGRSVNWISVPVIVTSHTWENSKNERSHQDPTLCEAWLSEMADSAQVLFPFDAQTAIASLAHVYAQRGVVTVLVIPKNKLPIVGDTSTAKEAVKKGYWVVGHDDKASIQLIAIGAYQLQQVRKAAERLRRNRYACSVVTILEPGKFRIGRDATESTYVYQTDQINQLIPYVKHRVVVTHTHADVVTGVLRQLDTGVKSTAFMGYKNCGGTLDVNGMQKANQQTWAHIVQQSAQLMAVQDMQGLLTSSEMTENNL